MRSTPVFVSAALAAALLVSPASAHDGGQRDRPLSRADTQELRAVKRATAKYRDVSVAVRDGYMPTDDCESAAGAGAMGFHYVNPSLGVDPAIRSRQPEILLYVPTASGGRKLAGVEYYRIDPDQDVSTVAGRPSRFNQPF